MKRKFYITLAVLSFVMMAAETNMFSLQMAWSCFWLGMFLLSTWKLGLYD